MYTDSNILIPTTDKLQGTKTKQGVPENRDHHVLSSDGIIHNRKGGKGKGKGHTGNRMCR